MFEWIHSLEQHTVNFFLNDDGIKYVVCLNRLFYMLSWDRLVTTVPIICATIGNLYSYLTCTPIGHCIQCAFLMAIPYWTCRWFEEDNIICRRRLTTGRNTGFTTLVRSWLFVNLVWQLTRFDNKPAHFHFSTAQEWKSVGYLLACN